MAASRCHVKYSKYSKDESALESMAASRCHVKYFNDESAHVSMAAFRCHVKYFNERLVSTLWQHLGVMLYVLKMSQPM